MELIGGLLLGLGGGVCIVAYVAGTVVKANVDLMLSDFDATPDSK